MKLYSDFHKAILENDVAQVAGEIKPHSRLTPEQQFAIYSEGYRVRLVQAIRSDYPILLKLLGDVAFDALAVDYIEQNPPASYNLDFYPHKFAGFVSENFLLSLRTEGEAIQKSKYVETTGLLRYTRNDELIKFVSELATLEATIAEVFMLPDSEPFSLVKFRQILPENFGEMIFNLRTACRLLQFSYPVSEWLSDVRAQEDLLEIPPENRSFLVMVRHNNEVQRHSLSEQEFALLVNLVSGKNVAEALEKTLEEQPSYAENIIGDLQSWFIGWIKNGVFIGV